MIIIEVVNSRGFYTKQHFFLSLPPSLSLFLSIFFIYFFVQLFICFLVHCFSIHWSQLRMRKITISNSISFLTNRRPISMVDPLHFVYVPKFCQLFLGIRCLLHYRKPNLYGLRPPFLLPPCFCCCNLCNLAIILSLSHCLPLASYIWFL